MNKSSMFEYSSSNENKKNNMNNTNKKDKNWNRVLLGMFKVI